MTDSTPRPDDDSPIMRRLLEAIADSENDHPGEAGEKYYVDFSRKDAMDAVARIVELRSALSAHKACVQVADDLFMQAVDGPTSAWVMIPKSEFEQARQRFEAALAQLEEGEKANG